MKILSLNCGSSSVKYKLFELETEKVLCKGAIERIGEKNSIFSHSCESGIRKEFPIKNHKQAIAIILQALTCKEHGAVQSLEELDGIGHRVVHGGEKFKDSVKIDKQVINEIKTNFELAPLHNPANLEGILACKEIVPNIFQAAVFDTAFHQTMPEKAFIYGLPFEFYEKHKIRRYGFHGTSHKFVMHKAAKYLEKDLSEFNAITCHLGNGASITAIKNGKSVDTSMGFTPLEGLVMGTRSGSIDPAIIQFIHEKENMNVKEIIHLLNKKSGLLGISKKSNDLRDLLGDNSPNARIALDVFTYSIIKTIGAYAAAMNGFDVLIFTAGIGENSSKIREKVCESLSFLGITIDSAKNNENELEISCADSKRKVLVVPTNEELLIARETGHLLNENK